VPAGEVVAEVLFDDLGRVEQDRMAADRDERQQVLGVLPGQHGRDQAVLLGLLEGEAERRPHRLPRVRVLLEPGRDPGQVLLRLVHGDGLDEPFLVAELVVDGLSAHSGATGDLDHAQPVESTGRQEVGGRVQQELGDVAHRFTFTQLQLL
jgi:hypothetical protein